MFTVRNVAGMDLRFNFTHFTDEEFIYGPRKCTLCEVLTGESGAHPRELTEKVTDVTVSLYYMDRYSKSEGRKYGLTKALSTLNLSKADRKKVWDEYWKILNNKH